MGCQDQKSIVLKLAIQQLTVTSRSALFELYRAQSLKKTILPHDKGLKAFYGPALLHLLGKLSSQ